MSRIETFFLRGPAGRIECMLKRPDAADTPSAAVVCHPHPLFGGTMHNKVVHAAAEAIVDAGIPVLRFNFRGVGGSGGTHDGGRGEQDDLRSVLDHLARLFPGRRLLVAGYSFGSFVALSVGCRDPRAPALIGIGIPVNLVGFGFLRDCRKPLTLIQGDGDAFGPLLQVMALAAVVPGGARVVVVKGAAHNFAGHLDELARCVAAAVPDEMRSAGRMTPPVGDDPAGVIS
ncbi:MAG TPA: alpha/beta family hydrolase [Candidatus Dormibacteraeota bacterium]|nr:alpha/beta family hydrolase [Candidatus Dormibacteraeota bacterium]